MNQLTRINEFKAVLQDYHLSREAEQILKDMRLVLLVGPSSSGRNTIIRKLLETGEYRYIVSDTTRHPRQNNGVMEENGREYWFRAEADILYDLQNGAFLEAAVIHNQQVSGISMRELKATAENRLIAINEIEVVGADNIQSLKPDTLFIFVVPPSFDEWIVRMQSRGQLPDDEVRRRLQSAIDEISLALERDYYHFVVNDTFAHTANLIHDMSRGDLSQAESSQAHGRAVAAQILTDTEAFLA